jgi:predicted RNase H-like HicB family nuclease
MKPKYEIVVHWSEAGGCFLAKVPELPKLITDGESRVEALRNAEAMIDDYLKTAQEAGWQIPEPRGRMAFA